METITLNGVEMTPPDFLNRKDPEVVAVAAAGRKVHQDKVNERSAAAKIRADELAAKAVKAAPTVDKPVEHAPKAAKSDVAPVKSIIAAPEGVTPGKKTDREMLKLIREHYDAGGGNVAKLLKHFRGMGIKCAGDRFKKLVTKAMK